MTRNSTLSMLVLSLTLGLGACSTSTVQTTPAPVAAAPAPITTSQRLIDKARADSIRHPYVQADIHFMSTMIGHHAQAIQMSLLVPTRNASPAVQRLAERIINAQEDEIVTMQHWLADRNQPVPEAKPGPMHMHSHGMDHDMLMPGMLSDEQMQELAAARGPAFDRLFLKYMIQHHKGATSMVTTLFGTTGAGQDEAVFRFATDVNVDQVTEIARMESMIESMPSAGTQ